MKKKDIAHKLNTNPANVTRWLNGTRKVPHDKLIPLSKVLGMSVEDLLKKFVK